MNAQGSEAIVLGTAQDGGIPQVGCSCSHCQDAWKDESLRRTVSSLALVDHPSKRVWVIDATPDFREQRQYLACTYPNYRLAGILLTHAHIGHYLGLASLGREAWNQEQLPVFATKRMIGFLSANHPWKQLVDLGNVVPTVIHPGNPLRLGTGLTATAICVPHRDELSDTVAFVISGPEKRLVYCPDIDQWESPILEAIADANVALIDGTFYSADELPSRDVSEIPHPCVADSIQTFAGYETAIHFIHLNHSNPLLRDGNLAQQVRRLGFGIASRGQRHSLGLEGGNR